MPDKVKEKLKYGGIFYVVITNVPEKSVERQVQVSFEPKGLVRGGDQVCVPIPAGQTVGISNPLPLKAKGSGDPDCQPLLAIADLTDGDDHGSDSDAAQVSK